MSQPVENPIASFVTNGVTTVFPYAFTLLELGDLVVTLDDLPVTSGFSVSGIGSTGGNVTFSVAPSNGQALVLARILPLRRTNDYQDVSEIEAEVLNKDFDRIIQMLQQMGGDNLRLIKLPIGTATDQTIEATPGDRANMLVGFDSSGNVTVLAPADLDLTTVSLFMRSFLEVEDAAGARLVLGLSSVPSTGLANTWTKAQRGQIVTLTDTATIPINFDDGNNYQVTLAGSRALGNPTNQVGGQGGSIFITQDATGSRLLTYGSNWKFPGGVAPVLSTAANAVDRLDYIVRSNGVIHATLSKDIK